MRILCDFHHSSLLRSLVLLFEGRLGHDIYRPIGMEWFDMGYWAINDQRDTAKQFLDYSSQPMDNTPPLNDGWSSNAYEFKVLDPGGRSYHNACTLDFFANNRFDILIASIPQHVPIFQELIKIYQPHAKLIIQMGNNWSMDEFPGHNVLASVAPQLTNTNVKFYHQEFDLTVFNDTPVPGDKKIYSFVNIIENTGIGWNDYTELRRALVGDHWEVKAYGGQCPDGNMNGAYELADKMREASFIFHVKPGGDGFGHIIHNAYAVGRPVITRRSHYAGQLAEELFVPGTYIDLDEYGRSAAAKELNNLIRDPERLIEMGKKAANTFRSVVNYKEEAQEIEEWLKNLL